MIDYYWIIEHWNETGLACRTCFDATPNDALNHFQDWRWPHSCEMLRQLRHVLTIGNTLHCKVLEVGFGPFCQWCRLGWAMQSCLLRDILLQSGFF